ncbi:hypothetical protein [Pseudovibrio sp. Alg231-02]|uniref:hypothetical protein n=1 Tax=Pseudovibrio sp. Alg231-02 TaxID=1922223 RepID=UPI000D54F85C|nr:hypothetical protein [Pseudovibrio sp. Alg231-02]
MFMKQFLRISILGFMILCTSTFVLAKDYVRTARVGYALWECAALGSITKEDSKQREVFFEKGHQELTKLFSGLLEGKVAEEDWNQMPIGLTLGLSGGPSLEFRLGVLWAGIIENVYESTLPEQKSLSWDDKKMLQKNAAQKKIQMKNCGLLVP